MSDAVGLCGDLQMAVKHEQLLSQTEDLTMNFLRAMAKWLPGFVQPWSNIPQTKIVKLEWLCGTHG